MDTLLNEYLYLKQKKQYQKANALLSTDVNQSLEMFNSKRLWLMLSEICERL